MTVTTDNSGAACCGNCGSNVVVACSGGCAEPDVVFRENYVATMKKPSGNEPEQAKYPVPTTCRHPNCDQPPVPPKIRGRGRPPTRCEKHWNPTSKRIERRQSFAVAQALGS